MIYGIEHEDKNRFRWCDGLQRLPRQCWCEPLFKIKVAEGRWKVIVTIRKEKNLYWRVFFHSRSRLMDASSRVILVWYFSLESWNICISAFLCSSYAALKRPPKKLHASAWSLLVQSPSWDQTSASSLEYTLLDVGIDLDEVQCREAIGWGLFGRAVGSRRTLWCAHIHGRDPDSKISDGGWTCRIFCESKLLFQVRGSHPL